MAKYLFMTLDFPPMIGGVSAMYRQLSGALHSDVLVWAPPTNDTTMSSEPYQITRKPMLSQWGWPKWLVTISRLHRVSKENQTSNIIVGQVLPLGTVAYMYSLVKPICYAVFIHGMDFTVPSQNIRRRILLRLIFGRAHAVFAANKYIAQRLTQFGVPPEKIKVVYPAANLTQQPSTELIAKHKAEQNLTNEPVVLIIARLIDRKGIQVILGAMEKVWAEFPNAHYIVIGAGPARTKLKVQKALLSKANQVHFIGVPSPEETAAWLSLCTIFAMTPIEQSNGDVEGLGIVFLEAGLFGKPVVASHCGGVPEGIIDGETGLLVPQGDSTVTAEAILRLLRDSSFRDRLGRTAQQHVSQNFTIDNGAAVIRQAFE